MPRVLPWSVPLGLTTILEGPRLKLAGIAHELVWRRRRLKPPSKSIVVDADPLVSFVCVSKRPAQLDHVVNTWQSQQGCRVELILVTNADGYAAAATERLEHEPNSLVRVSDPSCSLGEALNLGTASATGDVIAKIDDDDEYAATYAADLVATMCRTNAGVVGKKSYFVYLAAVDRTIKMYAGNENRRVGRVAGGTIGFHRQVATAVRFPDRTLGEDVGFVRAAERAGFAVYSGQAPGYLQIRAVELDHTWSITDEQLAASSEVAGEGRGDELWQ